MAIDFAKKTFGAPKTSPMGLVPAASTNSDKPKAQFWLNIGYDSGMPDSEGKSMFVSLPLGSPLDTQEHLPTNQRKQEYAQFQAARNDLLDQIMEAAKSLKPGEDVILNLQVQLRRVNEEAPSITSDEGNPFARKLNLFQTQDA